MPGTVRCVITSSDLHVLTYVILTTIARYHYYPQFIGEEAEAQHICSDTYEKACLLKMKILSR